MWKNFQNLLCSNDNKMYVAFISQKIKRMNAKLFLKLSLPSKAQVNFSKQKGKGENHGCGCD